MVDTLEDALDIVSRQGPVPCVTLAGETLRGSMVEGGRGVKGLLAPRREIREVSARQEEIEVLLRAARDRAQQAAARAEAAFAEARALEDRNHAAEKELVALRHDLASAEEEMSRLQRKGMVLDIKRPACGAAPAQSCYADGRKAHCGVLREFRHNVT